MALIRRAYKREFHIELVDDLLQRCGDAGSLLAQIAAKGATTLTASSQQAPVRASAVLRSYIGASAWE